MPKTNVLDGIQDISLPIAPIDHGVGYLTIILIVVVLASVMIGLFYYWWKKPRQHAKRALTSLLQHYKTQKIKPHQAVFELSEIIRARIQKNQLNKDNELPAHLAQHQHRWHDFIEELDDARYSVSNTAELDINQLAKETRFWIGRW